MYMLKVEIKTRKEKTVILKWNPAFSSYTTMHFLQDVYNSNKEYIYDFDWSVWEHENIGDGDRFYMVKVGEFGQNGIVMSGEITSDPEQGEDWSGRGRVTYYVNYEPDVMLDPDAFRLLSSAELQAAIPDFDWFKGHSGVVLTDEQAEKLDKLWKKYLKENADIFEQAKQKRNGSEKIYTK